MPEENQLAGNLLQEREQADREAAAKGQTPASTQPVYNPLLGVTQRQFMQIMAGNDPSKPMVSTDKYGTPQFHFENYGQNTPTQVQTNQFGQTYVPAVDEAFKQNAEQISQELEDFHYAFAPELAKDRQRSSYFNESLQAVPTFISEAGKSAGAPPIRAASGELPSFTVSQFSMCAISTGPNQSTTASTALLIFVLPPTSPSRSTVVDPAVRCFMLLVTPANADK